MHAEEEDVSAAVLEEVLRLDAEVQNKTTAPERGCSVSEDFVLDVFVLLAVSCVIVIVQPPLNL